MSKTLAFVFQDTTFHHVVKDLEKQLRYVFTDSVNITSYYTNSLSPCEKLKGDVFLIPLEDGIFDLVGHVDDISSVIVMTRVPSKEGMVHLLEVPENSDVLVVNDNDESTLRFSNSLYELGVTNLNLILFSESADAWKEYHHIRYAIMPEEEDIVPPFIKNVINVGYRMIDTYTMLRIINKLGLNSGQVSFNLLRYTELLAEPKSGLKYHFIANFLQIEMLKSYIHDIDEAMLLCDTSYRIIYTNKAFKRIFTYNATDTLSTCLGEERFSMIASDAFASGFTSIDKTNYQISKNSICVAEQLLGYCVMFRDERMIRTMEGKLSAELMRTGFYAKYQFKDIIHKAACMAHPINLAKKAARSEHSVVVSGESGTGKELFAQSIHNYSSRSHKPFVAINCAAMPEGLLESELFGYEGGAFTGARKNGKLGLFEQANGGSLFLDEISEIPLSVQAKLLRALQEKQIMRVGSDKVISVNVRIIASTNKNLQSAVANGSFREDLYYRINTLPLFLPPLRERGDDILLLLKQALGSAYSTIKPHDLKKILEYHWPGNVRELHNAAYYYQTMHSFLFLADSLEQNIPSAIYQGKSCEQIILRIIAKNTAQYHGIGRTALLFIMKAEGLAMSDTKLRILLKASEAKGDIIIGKGRIGNRITEKGLIHQGILSAGL